MALLCKVNGSSRIMNKKIKNEGRKGQHQSRALVRASSLAAPQAPRFTTTPKTTPYYTAKPGFLVQLFRQSETRNEAAQRRFEASRQAQKCYGTKADDKTTKPAHLVWA